MSTTESTTRASYAAAKSDRWRNQKLDALLTNLETSTVPVRRIPVSGTRGPQAPTSRSMHPSTWKPNRTA